jgi:hypothetical protein
LISETITVVQNILMTFKTAFHAFFGVDSPPPFPRMLTLTTQVIGVLFYSFSTDKFRIKYIFQKFDSRNMCELSRFAKGYITLKNPNNS